MTAGKDAAVLAARAGPTAATNRAVADLLAIGRRAIAPKAIAPTMPVLPETGRMGIGQPAIGRPATVRTSIARTGTDRTRDGRTVSAPIVNDRKATGLRVPVLKAYALRASGLRRTEHEWSGPTATGRTRPVRSAQDRVGHRPVVRRPRALSRPDRRAANTAPATSGPESLSGRAPNAGGPRP